MDVVEVATTRRDDAHAPAFAGPAPPRSGSGTTAWWIGIRRDRHAAHLRRQVLREPHVAS